MSSRVLRKLQGDKELEISHVDDEDEDELNFTSVKSKKKQKAVVNPFNLVSTNCIPRNTGWLATRKVLRLYLVHFKHLSLSLYVVLFVPLWECFESKYIWFFLYFPTKSKKNINRKSFNVHFIYYNKFNISL